MGGGEKNEDLPRESILYQKADMIILHDPSSVAMDVRQLLVSGLFLSYRGSARGGQNRVKAGRDPI